MLNNLLLAVEYNKYDPTTSSFSYLRHYKLEDYSHVYFGRRYLTEKEHAVLIPHGTKHDLPVYKDGVGFILLKENTYVRALSCSNCQSLCDSLEDFVVYENRTDYQCTNCFVNKTLWEEVITKWFCLIAKERIYIFLL